MKPVRWAAWMLLVILSTAACSVISRDIRSEAISQVGFKTLVGDVATYRGRTVILGGYILKTNVMADTTRIEVLQATLTFRDQPKSVDTSQGRFCVIFDGFMDPEVYRKDRRVTVAGNILGLETAKIGEHAQPYLLLEGREIHIWPEYQYQAPLYPYDRFYRHRLHPYRYYYDYW